MNSFHQRNSPFLDYPGSGLAILRGDEDHSDPFKMMESRFGAIHNDYYEDSEYDVDEYFHRPRTVDNYYGIRQEYLRSYTFTREEEPKPEKLKDSLKRFKAVVWAVLCCKYKSKRAKALREKLSTKSSRFIHDSGDYVSTSCRKITVPSCIRLSSLEVA